MTKKGGKSTRQINSHECPSELCLCFSPEKQLQPVQDSRTELGKGGELGKNSPGRAGGPCHCPGKGTATTAEVGTNVLQEAPLLPFLLHGGACEHPSRNVGQENPPGFALSRDRNVTCRSVTFRMDRSTFACIFPFFPLRAWCQVAAQWCQLGLRADLRAGENGPATPSVSLSMSPSREGRDEGLWPQVAPAVSPFCPYSTSWEPARQY